ncbi:Nif3-like dinuclear metal center hexameric protein [Neolewinella lacunae]|uniref:GTP cyclohydrolase 1 type 2 homolog n=1 Tax=Neolewinella lacunae TaxID=1517758 RepID=A0A923PGG9_9BACT|nr:Nif3-like dinuclear metal center hexameric protein [Neolewinella lacunae]MBC6993632.1 Nif3-like dinuclear metal center hexameric protein [Neolewinella lacunae]MDN3635538.1 Nif3-like dinuclear metal center hexameric protein [Neolewinella lacunae]
MTIKEITDYLESIAPTHLQEGYDNAGLIVGYPATEVTGVLTSLDCTEEIILEAKARGCNLVVAHHPIVFRGLKRFNGSNYVERTVIRAIREGVAIYAIHTNLDNVRHRGVNERIAQRLGLQNLRVLAPKSEDGTVGSGMVGELPGPMDETAFLAHLKAKMEAPVVKHTALLGRAVATVALCGGAGGFLLETAKSAGAQVFVTADYKYHEFFDADGEIVICDIGHYESEQFTTQLLAELLTEKFTTFAVLCTERITNPVRYFV